MGTGHEVSALHDDRNGVFLHGSRLCIVALLHTTSGGVEKSTLFEGCDVRRRVVTSHLNWYLIVLVKVDSSGDGSENTILVLRRWRRNINLSFRGCKRKDQEVITSDCGEKFFTVLMDKGHRKR